MALTTFVVEARWRTSRCRPRVLGPVVFQGLRIAWVPGGHDAGLHEEPGRRWMPPITIFPFTRGWRPPAALARSFASW